MKQLLTLILASFWIANVSGQTYSKKYVLNNFVDNFINDMKIQGDEIHLGISHFCDPDTTDNRRINCLGYYKIDLNGQLQDSLVLDTLFPVGSSSLLVTNERTYITANRHGQTYNRPTSIVTIEDKILTEVYALDTTLTPTNEGMFLYNDDLYLSGTQTDTSINRAHASIQKLDKNFNTVWSSNYARGTVKNECYSFQPTSDGNLIFINDYNGGAGSGHKSGIEIVKLDTSGNIIDTLNMESLRVDRDPRLLSARDGSLYIATKNALNEDNVPVVNVFNGTINKISSRLDSFIWSTPLPVKAFTYGRSYRIQDIKEARNGDIIAVGEAWDSNFDGILNNGHMINWNGFSVRLDAETGEIIWLRVYQQPIENPLLDAVEHGGHISGIIKNVHELDDGRLVFGGSSYHDGQQQSVLKPAGETVSFLWLMITDENGCIEGEECSENIVLDGEYRPTDGFLPFIRSDKEWFIAPNNGPGPQGPASAKRYTFSQDSIWQNGWYYEWKEYDNEADTEPEVKDLYKEVDGRVLVKTGESVQEEKILYDFTLLVGDTIDYFAENGDLHIVSKIDTVTYIDGVPRKRLYIECLVQSMGPITWIEGIGAPDISWNMCFSSSIDFGIYCYLEKGEKVYQLQIIEDDCYLPVGVNDELISDINIYPNPVKDILNVESKEDIQSFKIYNAIGSLVRSKKMMNNEVSTIDIAKGVYYLQLFDKAGKSQTVKFVKE